MSVRLIQPFLQLLAECDGFPVEVLDRLRALDIDDRIPQERAHKLLEAAVQWTGDPNLGLKAGRIFDLGDGGALDYAVTSAATVKEAIEVGSWCMRLLSNAVDFRLQIDGELAIARMDSRVPRPKEAADYEASILHTAHLSAIITPEEAAEYQTSFPKMGRASDVHGEALLAEWWFPHPKPEDTTEYDLTFAPTAVRFSAPCFGYAFHKGFLQVPLKTADPRLHAVICEHVKRLLAELPDTGNLTDGVRNLVIKELVQGPGRATAAQVARRLHMGQRTLARRLQAEGTTFKALLDQTRRELGLQYVAKSELTFLEVCSLLGFADVATFYRAFKRWTGQTPLQYRRSQGL